MNNDSVSPNKWDYIAPGDPAAKREKMPRLALPEYDRFSFWAMLADDSTEDNGGPAAHETLALKIVTQLVIDYLPRWMMKEEHGEFVSMVGAVADVIAAAMPDLDVSQFVYLHDGQPTAADYEANNSADQDGAE
jgi:hypothetical protein